jgi:rod shape-determining protein MreC
MLRNRLHLLSIGAFLVLVVLLFAVNPRNAQRLQAATLGLMSPFLKAGSSLATFRDGLKTLDQLEKEVGALRTQNKELRAVNQTLRDLEEENNRLRRSLAYRERAQFKLLPARVVVRDAGTWWNLVMIDKGFKDGVDADMPVVTEEGLVGKTTTVAAHMSTVVLLADETCRVAANVEGTREQGIARGERLSTESAPRVGLHFLSKNAALQRGQRVVTSGVGGVFPKGLPVGAIERFESRPLDGYATLVPAVDFSQLEDLFVVVGKGK